MDNSKHILNNKWFPIPGHPNCFITIDGIIKNAKGRILSESYSTSGYRCSALMKDKKYKRVWVHRVLAEIFIPNPENKPYVNHKNGIRSDNSLTNLEWCTMAENNRHAVEVLGKRKGEKNGNAKLNKQKVYEIKKSYVPYKNTRIKIAKQYGVSKSMIDKIIKGDYWK